jgi:hypothetical protein
VFRSPEHESDEDICVKTMIYTREQAAKEVDLVWVSDEIHCHGT